MARHYRQNTERGNQYSSEDISKALADIKAGRFTNKRAAKKYKIPSTSLYQNHKGLRKLKSTTEGRNTAIPEKDENKLANCLKTMEKWGYGLTRSEVLDIVGQHVKQNKIKTNFKDDTSGGDWFLNFKCCHNFSIKKPEAVKFARRKALDPFKINTNFDLLHELLLTNHSLEMKPEQIYNLDEISFCTDPSRTKIVGEVNSSATRTTSGSGKENRTVLFGANCCRAEASPTHNIYS
ncbi:hypothetical protein PR048_019621 [Dryococelus australis]|uniref:HTH psq-type domain-containing protein n=1 Tax=Dryococelus australis TaxID=614101 RepID=A0ABQ9H3Y9_9NEOP|nr:hypothetical protein PR048_019621 [Dryococelus australis]